MTVPVALVFLEHRCNKNSLAVLTGAVEVSPVAPAVQVVFAKPGRPVLAGVAPGTRRVVVAASFLTAGAAAARQDAARARTEAAAAGLESLLVAGGPHASADPEGTLALGFDAAIAGEGEETLPALLDRVSDGADFGDLPGLARRDGDAVRRNRRPAPVDLDRFPPFAPVHGRNAPFELSRGCPYACRFCQATYLFGRRMRHRSLDRLLEAAERARAGGLRDLRFLSPDAFAWGAPDGRTPDPARVEALLRAAAGIFGREHVFFGSFPAEARPESITPGMVALVKRWTASDNIVFGLQSGSPRMLRALHRGHGLDEVLRAVEVVRDGGLRPIVDFICGLPGEDDEDRRATRAAMERLAAMGATVNSHAFMPLPGTPLGRSPAGVVDDETRRLLDRLTGAGRHMGRWRTQEEIARRTAR